MNDPIISLDRIAGFWPFLIIYPSVLSALGLRRDDSASTTLKPNNGSQAWIENHTKRIKLVNDYQPTQIPLPMKLFKNNWPEYHCI